MTKPTKDQFIAARDCLKIAVERDELSLLYPHTELFRTLLDNALNPPDLERLKREVYAQEFVRHCETDRDLVSCVIDHLAPRIVREGMVQIPQDAMKLIDRMAEMWSSDECVEQGKEDECDFTDGYDMFCKDARKIKAMIAAAKGD